MTDLHYRSLCERKGGIMTIYELLGRLDAGNRAVWITHYLWHINNVVTGANIISVNFIERTVVVSVKEEGISNEYIKSIDDIYDSESQAHIRRLSEITKAICSYEQDIDSAHEEITKLLELQKIHLYILKGCSS